MQSRIWIAPDVLDWRSHAEAWRRANPAGTRRAHAIWEHARSKLTPEATVLDRVDAIAALKRCLNQRLKHIESIYRLRHFLDLTDTRYLQALAELGLARPMLIQHLMKVRNAIEHEDKAPPSLRRCLELLDVMWYFLRTTDRLVSIVTEMFHLEPDEGSRYGVELEVTIKRKWTILLGGWLPQDLLCYGPREGYLLIRAEKAEEARLVKKRGQHLDMLDSDVYLNGVVVQIPDRAALARAFLAAE